MEYYYTKKFVGEIKQGVLDVFKQYEVDASCVFTDEIQKDADKHSFKFLLSRFVKGDTLIVATLSDLGLSTKQILLIYSYLITKGVNVVVADFPTTDMRTEHGRAGLRSFLNAAKALEKVEADNRKRLQRAGIEKARRKGKHLGRPKKHNDEVVANVVEMNIKKLITGTQAGKMLGVSTAAFYHLKKRYQNKELCCGEKQC